MARSENEIEAQERYRKSKKGKAAQKRYKAKPEVNAIQKDLKRRYYEERCLNDPEFREKERARFKERYRRLKEEFARDKQE